MRAPSSFSSFSAFSAIVLALGALLPSFGLAAPRAVLADAVVDLRTPAGAALVGAEWRFLPATITEIDHHLPGPDLKPTGAANRTHDLTPRAGVAGFDDSAWEKIPADTLEARRGSGHLSFGWYRFSITIPTTIGTLPAAGSTVFLELVADDYAEIWVDGQLPRVPGSEGGAFPAGWNALQRVLLTRDAQPGQRIQLALLLANGPLSDTPGNYVWLRSATLDFYRPERAALGEIVKLDVTRLDPGLDAILPPSAKLEKLADGFAFTEGPVWLPADGGHLLFSDPNNNRVYRWSSADGTTSVYRTKSGYTGVDIGAHRQPGSNGLALDAQGRVSLCEHGNRRVTRLEKNGVLTVLADRYEGRRLNSPNDLIYRADGTLFFTDPFFGLPKHATDPARELDFTGVFAVRYGKVTLVTKELTGPNGLAFSPDQKTLYVGNWDDNRKVVLRYTPDAAGRAGPGELFADLTTEPGADAIDGVKVDQAGNVYVSGPGGLWIFAADGRRLGHLNGPEHPHNMAWGDADRRTLYLAAQNGLYRLRLSVPGAGATLLP